MDYSPQRGAGEQPNYPERDLTPASAADLGTLQDAMEEHGDRKSRVSPDLYNDIVALAGRIKAGDASRADIGDMLGRMK